MSDLTDYFDSLNWDSDPVADAAKARLALLRRQKNIGQGWHENCWQPADLLRQLGDQVLDPGEVRSRAFVEWRSAYLAKNADDVRNENQALDWLAAHTTTQEGPC